jgi:hypothetical protein
MYSNIPVITQEEFAQIAEPIPRLTTPPSLAAALVPHLPEKKLIKKAYGENK